MKVLALNKSTGLLPVECHMPPTDMLDLLGTPIASLPCWYERTEELENNFDVLQLIPVAYIMDTKGRVAYYQRRSNHTEDRLSGLHTMWFGGHVEKQDGMGGSIADIMKAALYREILEEATVEKEEVVSMNFIGYFQLDDLPVNKVHAAFAFRVLVKDTAMDRLASFADKTPENIEPAFIGIFDSLTEFKESDLNWEPWAEFYIKNLQDGSSRSNGQSS